MASGDTAGNGTDNGRAALGRFGEGNRFGRGNPSLKRQHELRRALVDSVDASDIRKVGRKLLAQAEDGDTTAAKLLLEYVIGRPTQQVELSGLDGEPIGTDWGRLQAVLVEALANFPDARLHVALALKGLSDDVRVAE